MSDPVESSNNIMISCSRETAALYEKYHAGKQKEFSICSKMKNEKVDILSCQSGVESSDHNIMISCSRETAALYGKYLADDKSTK